MTIDRYAGGFTIIGENIHATRVLLKKGTRFVVEGDREAITFTTVDGHAAELVLAPSMRSGQDYDEGRIKHVRIAMRIAMDGGEGAETAMAYLEQLVVRQQRAGAAFIDVNVDEVSPKPPVQEEMLAWAVDTVQTMTQLPLSIDSSSIDLLETGLERCDTKRDRPLLNSASLERLDALDIARSYNARIVISAAGASGMPDGAEQRFENASAMVDTALNKGIPPDDLFVDPLIFPIAVDGAFGQHALDAIRMLRARFGEEIHITGGFSNVSFGIPARRIINDVFLRLAIEAGADSGIVDPVTSRIDEIVKLDTTSQTYRLAEDVLMGRDEHCSTYIGAWRQEQLQPLS